MTQGRLSPDNGARIEAALQAAISTGDCADAPPLLMAALRHAVFPGGARIRPRLCLAVAQALGEDCPEVTDAVAVSIELLHCASLVHDDLPCFDNAAMRRGRPSVQSAYGERLAVLAGDGLIVLAFQCLGPISDLAPQRLAPLLLTIGRSVSAPAGIVAGQAWECEPSVSISRYHRAKTGSLFGAAATLGAQAVGCESREWTAFGEYLGEAYQVADDIRDVAAADAEIGKPTGRDAALGRPNIVAQEGLDGAIDRLRTLVHASIESIPVCPGAARLRELVVAESVRLMPKRIARRAA